MWSIAASKSVAWQRIPCVAGASTGEGGDFDALRIHDFDHPGVSFCATMTVSRPQPRILMFVRFAIRMCSSSYRPRSTQISPPAGGRASTAFWIDVNSP